MLSLEYLQKFKVSLAKILKLGEQIKTNPIYKLNISKLGLPPIDTSPQNFNFTPITIIKEIMERVNATGDRILFLDYDECFQIYESAMSVSRLLKLRTIGMTINESAHLPS